MGSAFARPLGTCNAARCSGKSWQATVDLKATLRSMATQTCRDRQAGAKDSQGKQGVPEQQRQ